MDVRENRLGQLRQPVDDPQSDFVSHLHLHHLSRQAGPNTLGVLQLELDLPPTALDQMEQKQRGQALKLIVGCVFAQVENLGHR